MKQPTTEEKATYFASHKGAELMVIQPPKEHWYPFDINEAGLLLAGVLGQRIIVNRIAEEVHDKFNQCALSLFDLSAISDKDAIEVAKLAPFNPHSDEFLFRRLTNKIIVYEKGTDEGTDQINIQFDFDFVLFSDGIPEEVNAYRVLEIVDYLRSKSYALPFNGYSVEQLISFGWMRHKEEKA